MDNPSHSSTKKQTPVTETKKRRPPLSLKKKCLFTLLTVAVFFGLLEAALAILAIRPASVREDPFVGFADYNPLFVQKRSEDGKPVFVTAENKRHIFNLQQFPRQKSEETYRIFCLGGSTTYGRPYDDKTSFSGWLRAFLPKADPSRHWQVVNAGGVSYATYRVARLMEELVDYRPDLFIVYTGHNEFLERRTYKDLIETPQWQLQARSVLNRSRVYSLLKKTADSWKQDQDKNRSKYQLSSEVDALLDHTIGPDDYSRDDSLKQNVFSHFRFNINRMISLARSADAHILFVTPACNLKDSAPFKSQFSEDLSAKQRNRFLSLFEQGKKQKSQGNIADALKSFQQALKLDKRYAALHYWLGKAHFQQEEFEKASFHFRRAVEEDVCPLRAPTQIEKILLEVTRQQNVPVVNYRKYLESVSLRENRHAILGDEYFLDHVHPTIRSHRMLALQLIDRLIDLDTVHPHSSWNDQTIEKVTRQVEKNIDPDQHAKALKNLSKVLGWTGKQEEAGKLALKALEAFPQDPECLFMVGLYYRTQGELDKAADYYRKALQQEPNFTRVHTNLANVLRDRGKEESALEHYSRALQIDPEYSKAHLGLAQMFLEHQRYEKAIPHYQEFLRLQPNNAVAHLDLGIALVKSGNLKDGIQHYRQAIRIRPGIEEVHYNLANALRMQGNFSQAVTSYRKALEINPQDEAVHINLGLTLEKLQRTSEAEQHYRQALELNPRLPEGHVGLANLLNQQGQWKEAASHFRQALELRPEWPPALVGLAWLQSTAAEARFRNADEAIRLARKANQATRQRSPRVLDTLAAAYAEAGQFQQAVSTAQSALEIASNSRRQNLAKQIESRLQLYRRQKPYRQK